MKPFNPKKKPFIYGLDQGALAAGARGTGRTAISSDSWFELHAISAHLTAAVLDALYFNIYDDSTGRSLFSEPVSVPAMLNDYSTIGARNIGAGGDTYYPWLHRPTYFATPYMVRPGAVLRAEIENRDGASALTTMRLYYHGLKVFDIASRDQSPGAVFGPFSYVANFGAVANGAIANVTVPIQSDADFDIVNVKMNSLNFDALSTDASQGYLQFTDLTTGYQFQDRAVSAIVICGTPNSPYHLIRPWRMSAAGGLQVTFQNTSGGALADMQVVFDGYKIFR